MNHSCLSDLTGIICDWKFILEVNQVFKISVKHNKVLIC